MSFASTFSFHSTSSSPSIRSTRLIFFFFSLFFFLSFLNSGHLHSVKGNKSHMNDKHRIYIRHRERLRGTPDAIGSVAGAARGDLGGRVGSGGQAELSVTLDARQINCDLRLLTLLLPGDLRLLRLSSCVAISVSSCLRTPSSLSSLSSPASFHSGFTLTPSSSPSNSSFLQREGARGARRLHYL